MRYKGYEYTVGETDEEEYASSVDDDDEKGLLGTFRTFMSARMAAEERIDELVREAAARKEKAAAGAGE